MKDQTNPSELPFQYDLPPGWAAEPDEEGGVLISAEDGVGLLHLVAFQQAGEEPLDPAEELYAFLEDQEIELEEDEIEDVDLPSGGELAICEYLAEPDVPEGEQEERGDESDEELAYWLIGVATAPGSLIFANYSCPAGEEDTERETIRRILTSLRLP